VTPDQFVATYGAAADRAAAGTGLSRWTILTQWGLETGWCAPDSGCYCNNLAGIGCHHYGSCPRCNSYGFCCYDSAEQYAADYVAVLHNGPYAGVLASAGTTLRRQMVALGESPWAASHYDGGGGPGSSLISVYLAALERIADVGLDQPLGPGGPPPLPSPPPPVYPSPAPPLPPPTAGVVLLATGVAALTVGAAEWVRPGSIARVADGLESGIMSVVQAIRARGVRHGV
jgi:hypothetical protein